MKISQAARKAFGEAGKSGGAARAAKLTSPERIAIAKRAAAVRWGTKDAAQALPEAAK